jgi:glyoxylase-like metal-dependent hydrolase (beta-lactamase superfamily II)
MSAAMPNSIPLEDCFEDVIGKACRGLGIEDATLSFLTGVQEETIAALKEGEFNEEGARALCSTLGLDADSLVAMARGEWAPEPLELDGLRQFNSDYRGEMTVNAYLAWDAATGAAAIFDTGASADELLAAVEELGVEVKAVLLTHTHHDHIIELERVLAATGRPPVYVSEREPVPGADLIVPGKSFQIGGLAIESRLTAGHSIGGISYVIYGLARPVAVVGDALFSSSMGGGVISFPQALECNRKELFTLPDDCVVCPGHGPMTTIGEEKAHNPFYPEFKR